MSAAKHVLFVFGGFALFAIGSQYAFNSATRAVLKPATDQAVANVERLREADRLQRGVRTPGPKSPPAPPEAPPGWGPDGGWTQASASSTSRNAGP